MNKNRRGGAKKQNPGQLKKRAAHDPLFPEQFVSFMLQGWSPEKKRSVKPVAGLVHYRKRRRVLSTQMGRMLLVIPGGGEVRRSSDTHYRFRAGSDLFYLTGHKEPDAVLVLVPASGRRHARSILFLPADIGRTSPGFFADRDRGELWVGKRLGPNQAKKRYGVDEAYPLEDLEVFLKKAGKKRAVLRGICSKTDAMLGKSSSLDHDLRVTLSGMRLCKDALEVAALQRAARATLKAYDALVAAIPTAKNERDLEAAFGMQARLYGDDVGYGTIVAAGSHACVLHWTNNDGALKRGDLVLIDAGVESDALYTADVTRVFPVSGKFTSVQRQVVELVLKAQAAAMRVIKPGAAFLDPHRAAMRVLAEGLIAWEILGCTLEEALDPKNMFYRRYTLHGTSHMLGLDVHDCSEAPMSRYRDGKLEPGMVITVEPGLYFQEDDRTVPRAFRGIGVRIEDDVLVTPKGHRNLTHAIPKTPDDVEAWMKQLRR